MLYSIGYLILKIKFDSSWGVNEAALIGLDGL
jgi:hypothetical protein